MKNKKKIGLIIFFVICVLIVSACIIIQGVIKQEDKKLKNEMEKLEVLTTKTKGGVEIDTEYSNFDNNEFYIKVPKNFNQLDYEMVSQKYSGDVPDIVISNDDTKINIALSLNGDKISNNQIKVFKETMVDVLKNNSEIIKTDYYEVDNHNIGRIKLISHTQDTDIYNDMIFFSYNDELVVVTFNCTTDLQDEWQSVGDFIIDSLFFKD